VARRVTMEQHRLMEGIARPWAWSGSKEEKPQLNELEPGHPRWDDAWMAPDDPYWYPQVLRDAYKPQKGETMGHEWYEKMKPETVQVVDGEQWVYIKLQRGVWWKRNQEMPTYRLVDTGLESQDPETGEWRQGGVMPKDVSHLTPEQVARLQLEVKGINISMNMNQGDLDDFTPLPEVPPLEQWPYRELEITEDFKITDAQVKDFKVMEMSKELGLGFFLSSRWKLNTEARRQLGYSVNDSLETVSNINGTVLALRAIVDQLKVCQRFRKLKPEDQLKAKDAGRLKAMQCTGFLGTKKGSAIAIWSFNQVSKLLKIDVAVGDDVNMMGPYAEEMLVRYLAREAANQGAEKVWLRTRRTESGKIYIVPWIRKLQFKEVPADLQQEEEWESFKTFTEKEEDSEHVHGLKLWLSTRSLAEYLKPTNQWCKDMGAADVSEVKDNRDDLADFLTKNHGLTEKQREKLMEM